MSFDEDEDCTCVGECLSADVVESLTALVQGTEVCHRCGEGGKCGDDAGCDLTVEFISEMRRAARTIDILNRIYIYGGGPKWSPDQIRSEARYLEKSS